MVIAPIQIQMTVSSDPSDLSFVELLNATFVISSNSPTGFSGSAMLNIVPRVLSLSGSRDGLNSGDVATAIETDADIIEGAYGGPGEMRIFNAPIGREPLLTTAAGNWKLEVSKLLAAP